VITSTTCGGYGSTSTNAGSRTRPVIRSLARIDEQKFYARVGGAF